MIFAWWLLNGFGDLWSIQSNQGNRNLREPEIKSKSRSKHSTEILIHFCSLKVLKERDLTQNIPRSHKFVQYLHIYTFRLKILFPRVSKYCNNIPITWIQPNATRLERNIQKKKRRKKNCSWIVFGWDELYLDNVTAAVTLRFMWNEMLSDLFICNEMS